MSVESEIEVKRGEAALGVDSRTVGIAASLVGSHPCLGPFVVRLFDWLAAGRYLFGDDYRTWFFVCPGCESVQSVWLIKGRHMELSLEDIEKKIEWSCFACGREATNIAPVVVRVGKTDVENPLCGFKRPCSVPTFRFYGRSSLPANRVDSEPGTQHSALST